MHETAESVFLYVFQTCEVNVSSQIKNFINKYVIIMYVFEISIRILIIEMTIISRRMNEIEN